MSELSHGFPVPIGLLQQVLHADARLHPAERFSLLTRPSSGSKESDLRVPLSLRCPLYGGLPDRRRLEAGWCWSGEWLDLGVRVSEGEGVTAAENPHGDVVRSARMHLRRGHSVTWCPRAAACTRSITITVVERGRLEMGVETAY